ncbi:hypothetical protein CRUP_037523 [Coryphaenoides rupestris]|nr:hypothetical protein CRUP_037523 [Coryphaenoides rupestris]
MASEDKALRDSEVRKTARGGKKNDQQQESEDSGRTGSSADPGAGAGDKIDQLSELVKALMQSQTARDKMAEKESSRQGQRWKRMQQQLKEMQGQVHDVMEDRRQGPESGRTWREAESAHADADEDLYYDPGEMTSNRKLSANSLPEVGEDAASSAGATSPPAAVVVPSLTPEEQEELQEELAKVEDEIQTLSHVLAAKEKELAEIKRKLGITPLNELKQNFTRSWQEVTTSNAYRKTSESITLAGQRASAAFTNMGTAITRKLEDVK